MEQSVGRIHCAQLSRSECSGYALQSDVCSRGADADHVRAATASRGTLTDMSEHGDAWVRLPSRDALRQFGVQEHHGFIPAMFRLVAAHGRVALHFAALSEAVMGAPGELT